MQSVVIDRIPHSCGTTRGLVVYGKTNGELDGYCWACDTYVPHPYGEPKKVEDLPPRVEKTKAEIEAIVAEISTYPTVDVKERKLRAASLEALGVKIGLSERDGKTPREMYFPLTKNGKVTGYQVKTIGLGEHNKVYSVGDCKDVDLFNWENAKKSGARRLIVTEGMCFPPNAEVFTEGGWVSFEKLRDEKVMQVSHSGAGTFVKPLAYLDKQYEGDLIEYKSGSYYSLTTPDHNLVRVGKNGKFFKTPSENSKKKHYNIPRVLTNLTNTSDDLLKYQIWVMLSADFTFRKEGDLYASIKKIRKVNRAKELLDLAGVRYSCNEVGRGYHSIFIHRGHGLDFASKKLSFDMVSDVNRRAILDEVVFWDGNKVKGRQQAEFVSKLKHNADVVQALAHSCGYVSTIMTHNGCFKVSILYTKTESSTQNGFRRVPYSGRVMCVTVPSGMLLVRQNNSISISGNCDAVAVDAIFRLYGNPDWFPAIVSIPYGAGRAHTCLQKHSKDINRLFKEVLLCFDNDKPGQDAVEKSILVLPQAKKVTLPEKDANDCIIKGRAKAAYNAMSFQAEVPKNTRLVFGKELHDKSKQPAKYGELTWPFEKMNKDLRGIRLGETIYISAGVKCGKSTLKSALVAHFIKNDNAKVFVAASEEPNEETYKRIAGQLTGKIFHDPEVPFDEEAFDKAGEIIGDKLVLLNLYQQLSWETLKEDIIAAVTHGCKVIVVDPITSLSNGISSGEANTLLQSFAQDLAAMAKDLNFVAILFAHLKAPEGQLSEDKRSSFYAKGKYLDLGNCSHEQGGSVYSNQIAGSRAMMRSAHLLLALLANKDPDLPEEIRNTRQIQVLEDRNLGVSEKYSIFYNKATGTFVEI